VVKEGDTLSGIAGEEYEDPRKWRPIADFNRIDSPRILKPGQILAIPALS
jgi:nucleoid-associated protein YgaU